MKKLVITIAVFLVAAAACAAYALAAGGADDFYVSEAGNAEMPASSVKVCCDSNGHGYLFLPSYVDSSNIQFWYSGSAKVTLDGTEITNGETVSGFVPGTSVSISFGSKSYTVEVMQSAEIPALFISTASGTMSDIDASVDHSYQESGNMLAVNADGTKEYSGELTQVKGRGNSTWASVNDKKPYQIKLSTKSDLFGMGKAKTWCLLADYFDRSLLRNYTAFNISASSGQKYSPDETAVDLYTNGEYRGTYHIATKVQIDGNRIAITDLEKATENCNDQDLSEYTLAGDRDSTEPGTYKYSEIASDPADITGGYLLEVDYPVRYEKEASGFVTDAGVCVVIKEPEYASKAEVEYIRAYVQEMEDAMLSATGYNSKGRHYSDYMDVGSFEYKMLMEEFCGSVDGGRSSFYFYKDSDASGDGKVCFGPDWDYDLAFGLNTFSEHDDSFVSEWSCIKSSENTRNIWFAGMSSKREVVAQLCTLYNGSFRKSVTDAADQIDAQALKLSQSAAMNFKLYSYLLDENGDTYQDEVDYLKEYLDSRLANFDTCVGVSTIATDITANEWYSDFVEYSLDNGIMSGTSALTFSPDIPMTRAMFVTVLYNYEKDDTAYAESRFSDVDQADYYYNAVTWASANGITSGTSADTFSPEMSVTREQMCTLINNYLKYKGITANGTSADMFSDNDEISPWALEAVYNCRSEGIVSGMGGNIFSPRATATRAQVAAVMFKVSVFIAEK